MELEAVKDPGLVGRGDVDVLMNAALKRLKGLSRAVTAEGLRKIKYYVVRSIRGYGPIDALMRDPEIEDVSCSGVGSHVFVWHRRYEHMRSNIRFVDLELFNAFVSNLAYKGGKHLSVSSPVAEAVLEGIHRLSATYGSEISPGGPTFSIRKFRERPISVTELIESGTLSAELAAYLWILMENRVPILIYGPTAAGKTTLMNALLSLADPGLKVVTVEDTPEINIASRNWVRLTVKEAHAAEPARPRGFTLYDLVKIGLRYRPDYLVVGEIRGEEAYVFFQAASTGHGGMTTVHAESVEDLMLRLSSPPMNVPRVMISRVGAFVGVSRTRLPRPRGGLGHGRRVIEVHETSGAQGLVRVARWVPEEDRHEIYVGASQRLKQICGAGCPEEVGRRSRILAWMVARGVRDPREVVSIISLYRARPDEVLARAAAGGEEPLRPRGELIEATVRDLLSRSGGVAFEELLARTGVEAGELWPVIGRMALRGEVVVGRDGVIAATSP